MDDTIASNVTTALPSSLAAGFPTVGRTIATLRKCLHWAWLDTLCQYRRSKIGPLWETINVVVMLLGLTLVSSAIFGGEIVNVMGYIGLGVIVWSAISSLITEGTTAFIKHANLIASSNLSIVLYVGRTVFKVFITTAHHLILYVVGVVLMLIPLHWTSLLALPGLALLFVNGFWIVMLLALVCARFRDVELIVRNLLQLAFFVTPVFWNYQHVASSRRFLVDYNILFYFIEIVRGPLLGEIPPLQYYLVTIAVTAGGYGLAYLAYRRLRPQLAFFV